MTGRFYRRESIYYTRRIQISQPPCTILRNNARRIQNFRQNRTRRLICGTPLALSIASLTDPPREGQRMRRNGKVSPDRPGVLGHRRIRVSPCHTPSSITSPRNSPRATRFPGGWLFSFMGKILSSFRADMPILICYSHHPPNRIGTQGGWHEKYLVLAHRCGGRSCPFRHDSRRLACGDHALTAPAFRAGTEPQSPAADDKRSRCRKSCCASAGTAQPARASEPRTRIHPNPVPGR